MNFYNVVNSKDEPLADIVEFEDGSCVLKFYIFKKIHCFDNFAKLRKYMESMRLNDIKIIFNGIEEDTE